MQEWQGSQGTVQLPDLSPTRMMTEPEPGVKERVTGFSLQILAAQCVCVLCVYVCGRWLCMFGVPVNVPTADLHIFKQDHLIMSCVMRSEI